MTHDGRTTQPDTRDLAIGIDEGTRRETPKERSMGLGE